MTLTLLVRNRWLEYINYSQFWSTDWLSNKFAEPVIFLFRIVVLKLFLTTPFCHIDKLGSPDLTTNRVQMFWSVSAKL